MPSDRPSQEPDTPDDGEDRSVLARAGRDPDLVWTYGTDAEHVADVYLPREPVSDAPVVVLVHGGFWRPEYDRTHLRPLAAALADHGAVVVSLEYRRLPGLPDATIADLRLAMGQVADQPWAAGRPVIVSGHSAGGHLALLLAAEEPKRLAGCVALAPVADLTAARERGLDGDAVAAFVGDEQRLDLDPTSSAHPGVPVLLVHGDADSLVPLALSQSYASAHAEQTRLVVLPETGHFELIDPQASAFAEVLTALGLAGIE